MKSKPKMVKISKEIWRQLVVDTLFNTHSLASSSKILLKENLKENRDVKFEDPHVAAGLYLFAIEEYGKALILENYQTSNDEVEIKYSDEFRYHKKKFAKALANLPDECKLLHKGSFGKGFDIDEFASLEKRISIFYSDIDEGKKVNILPQIDAEELQKCLDKFMEIVQDNLASFNIQNRLRSPAKQT